MNKLFLIDCMKYMKTREDNAFDLAIVDPPYGVGRAKSNQIIIKNKTWKQARKTDKLQHKKWDDSCPDKIYFIELFRIAKHQIIWGGNLFPLPITKGWIIWDKKISNTMFSPFEMAWTDKNKSIIFRYMFEGYKRDAGKEREIRIHPTQKPIDLYKWLLQDYAKPGDKLFDSHSGSGSFRIAAHDLGFDLVSCENDPDYFRDNETRFQRHIRQSELFEKSEYQDIIYDR